jgi:hypothetical protein
VYAEQGVGDEIMFASCLPDVLEGAGGCIVECDRRLVPLFARSFPKAKVVERVEVAEGELPEELMTDVKVAMGSLPLFFRTDISRFPQQERYLVADAGKVQQWRERYRERGEGKKIGISWRGGSKPGTRLARSIGLEKWRDIFGVSGVEFINLQYGDCAAEIKEAEEKLGVRIYDWADADPLRDLDGAAAQIAALDLVISVDNTTVHMAAALGVPVWVMLPVGCDWRWIRGYDDTPWYKTVRLYRQERAGEWEEVLERVVSDLRGYIDRGTVPDVPPERSYRTQLS